MGGVGAGKNHSWTRRYLQIEFVEDSLIFIKFTKALIEVVCHIEDLHWSFRISNVPNLNCEIVTRKDIVVTAGCEFCPSKRANDVSEKVAFLIILSLLKNQSVFLYIWGLSQITDADVCLTWAIYELISVVRMEFCVCDNFWQVPCIRWLNVN